MATRQFSAEYRDGAANLLRTTLAASPLLRIYTGSLPANCAAAATGTLLATLPLPSTAMTTSSGGAGEVTKSGTWSGTGSAAGTAGYYRLEKAAGGVVEQGDVTNNAGDGACKLANTSIAVDQPVEITSYSFLIGGA